MRLIVICFFMYITEWRLHQNYSFQISIYIYNYRLIIKNILTITRIYFLIKLFN